MPTSEPRGPLSRQGGEGLGVEAVNGHHQSLAHEYWKRYYARRYAQEGYQVQIEAACGDGRADVLACKAKEVVAIEIETGMSDAVGNVKRDMLAGCSRVLVIATDEMALAKVERELAKFGLLIKPRVQLQYCGFKELKAVITTRNVDS